jgi:amino acid transporter
MALLAFVFGDYLAQWFDLGNQASAAFGATAVVALIAINMRGVHPGLRTQLGLMGVVVFGLACVGLAGVWYALSGAAPLNPQPAMARTEWRHIGNAMIFVFLAYGGWSDAATLSAEMRDEKRGIVWALLGGLLIVAVLYLGANWAYVRILGLGGLAASQAPAAEAMRQALGRTGEILVVATVAVSAISVMNALLMVGARTTYAAMRDWRGHVHLGHWDEQRGTPVKAMLAMGAVALCQIGLGSLAPHGFSAMVDYLTPVYWFFLSLSATAVMVMRYRYPEVPRPFKTPWFPFAPLLFLASSLYMLYASLVFVRAGALMGLAVLGLGAVLFWREPGKTAP